MNNIGSTICRLLENSGMSQRELASRLHIAPTTLNGYIKSGHEPDYKTLIKIADIFNVSTDILLDHVPSSSPEELRMTEDISSLSPQQKELVRALIDAMKKQNKE